MAKRTPVGYLAHLVNSGLAGVGLSLTKIPERNTLERKIKDILKAHQIDLVIDVGAHHGEFGWILRELGYRGRILSFEPSKDAFSRLSERQLGDKLWDLSPLCLGLEDGEVEIQTFRQTTLNSLHPPTKFATEGFMSGDIQPVGIERVPMRRLDSILPELGIDPAQSNLYLKIDTQGHDLQVLQGASGVLSNIDVLQVELAAVRLYGDVPRMGEALDKYRDLGFLPEGFFSIPNYKQPTPIIEWDCILTRADDSHLANG